jgi:hypothetical protein
MNDRRFVMNAILVLSLWALVGASLAAQNAPATNGASVKMLVTVEAVHGSDVPDIHREDVMVHEGHDRDQVTDWVAAQGDHAGLELVVLLDDSSGSSLGTQLEDLRKLINAQPASTKIGVAYMDNGSARFEQSLTSDHALAAKALRLPRGEPGVNGSPYFSLSDLVKHWPESTARREVLMVSDGIDRYYDGNDLGDPYLASAIEDVQRAGIVVFAIYTPGAGHSGHSFYRTYTGQIYLSKVTDETGGESYSIGFNGAPVSFAPYLEDLARRLTHQYLLTFTAKPPKKSGLQRVKITTEIHNAELVSADAVYVPAEQR